MKKEIKIMGSGISGLSAAINLAKSGFKTTIFEKNPVIGKRFTGDFQGLENWSKKIDVLEELKSINIETNFPYYPLNKLDIFDSENKKFRFRSKKRIGAYVVRRGIKKDCLDFYLLKQCRKLGIRIKFNKFISKEKADIIASGPTIADGIARGITFKTDSRKDYSSMILDDEIAPKGYAYLLAFGGKGCMVTVLAKHLRKSEEYFEKTLERYKRLYSKLKIRNSKNFAGYGNCFLCKDYTYKGKPIAGEAAGFQDFLWGFGMRLAFLSGYYAAQSITENKNYNKIIKKNIEPFVKNSIVNRFLYERVGNIGYKIMAKGSTDEKSAIKTLNKVYNYTLLKKIIFPISELFMESTENRHKDCNCIWCRSKAQEIE